MADLPPSDEQNPRSKGFSRKVSVASDDDLSVHALERKLAAQERREGLEESRLRQQREDQRQKTEEQRIQEFHIRAALLVAWFLVTLFTSVGVLIFLATNLRTQYGKSAGTIATTIVCLAIVSQMFYVLGKMFESVSRLDTASDDQKRKEPESDELVGAIETLFKSLRPILRRWLGD